MKYVVWTVGLVVLVVLASWLYQTNWGQNIPDIGDETTTVQVYFNESQPTDIVQVAVEREVLASGSCVELAEQALQELLQGPTQAENDRGLTTAIQDGSRLNYVRIEGDVAILDFNDVFDFQLGGSALVTAIYNQLNDTVTQFDCFNEIRITIDHESREAVLEP